MGISTQRFQAPIDPYFNLRDLHVLHGEKAICLQLEILFRYDHLANGFADGSDFGTVHVFNQ